MSSIDSLLDNIYVTAGRADETAIEKTAEARMLESLSDVGTDNPYRDLSLDDLVKIANEAGLDVGGEVQEDDMEKQAAYEAFGGQVMAHAAVHEMGLIKEALANGICRVCKENHLDVEGSSICSACLG